MCTLARLPSGPLQKWSTKILPLLSPGVGLPAWLCISFVVSWYAKEHSGLKQLLLHAYVAAIQGVPNSSCAQNSAWSIVLFLAASTNRAFRNVNVLVHLHHLICVVCTQLDLHRVYTTCDSTFAYEHREGQDFVITKQEYPWRKAEEVESKLWDCKERETTWRRGP